VILVLPKRGYFSLSGVVGQSSIESIVPGDRGVIAGE